MNIIEKLGIEPIERKYNKKIWDTVFSQKEVRELEQQNRELLERDIRFFNQLERIVNKYQRLLSKEEFEVANMIYNMYDLTPDLKATGKTWEEIKELLK